MNDKEWLEHAVLVYGPRKSGTTLLQNLLDGNEEFLMVPGELKLKLINNQDFFPVQIKKETYLSSGRSLFKDNMNAHRLDSKVESSPDDRTSFKIGTLSEDQLNSVFNFSAYMDGLKGIEDPQIKSLRELIGYDLEAFRKATLSNTSSYGGWASKEVGGDPSLIVAIFKAMFPFAKFVFVSRNPLFNVRSIILDRRRKGVRMSTRRIVAECFNTYSSLTYYSKIRDYHDKILIFYEELVDMPEREMKKIATFLNIPFDRKMTMPTTLGINSRVSTSSKDSKKIFNTSTKSWTANLTLREIAAIATSTVFHWFASFFGRGVITYGMLRSLYKQHDSQV